MNVDATNKFQEQLSSYEGIADSIVALLRRCDALAVSDAATPWDAYLRLSHQIHESYEIPSTTITPIMRRLLFALGFAARPSHVVGVGTFVGYAISWVLRDRSDNEAAPFVNYALGADIDHEANEVARRNCAILGHGNRLTFQDCDGITIVGSYCFPIDLLYLDLDDPATGKAGYRKVAEAAMPRLTNGSVILAHDVCVPRFRSDIEAFHGFLLHTGRFVGPWVLPVDDCGLSVSVVR